MKTSNKHPALFLMGPTAAGKTELALELANHLPVEIISVDSAMVYRGMDIGTGKPDSKALASVPHHLINIRDPSEPYSAAEFASDALEVMGHITGRNKIPLLVGGTMLYFRALQQGLSEIPSADPAVRARLSEEAARLGWAALHQRLSEIDKASATRIHPNDPQRIQRALEVYEISGKPLSEFFKSGRMGKIALYDIHAFALAPEDRKILHQRIEKRFYKMVEHGLVLEVKKLFEKEELNPQMPSMRAVGYRQIWSYLAGECTEDEMIAQSIAATRQLAKRQLTWLRSLSDIKWLQNEGLASLKSMIHCVS